MPLNLSLRERISSALLAMTIAVATLFSIGIYVTLHSLEDGLFNRFFTEHARWIIDRYQRGDPIADELPDYISFYHWPRTRLGQAPDYLRGLEPGWHEVVQGELGLHVYVADRGDERLIVVHDQSEFEQREITIAVTLGIGMIVTVLAALWLGSRVARTVMRPLARLTRQVRTNRRIDPAQYPDDELRELAGAFDSFRADSERFLQRERLFTSDVSHELRTPLMSASSAIELALDQGGDPRTLGRARAALAEMNTLVATFLHRSRHRGTASEGPGTPSIAAVARAELDKLAASRAPKPLALHLEVLADTALPTLDALLHVVIGNLLRNAYDYTEAGEIRIIVDGARMRLVDTGSGIPAAVLRQVFGDTVDPQPLRDAEGHGLGLFIVKRICDHCGWSIAVDSDTAGTRFDIDFAAAAG